eukprot:CAMPEP_0116882870 /NCGR_PEP_ID=MMETSP0463-20121206/15271_1 /TAXON_ID=181622 /ORGANISM="Strombidinopsis sp, Strain SopsisLIS2011" /LENGTH=55 /DNA_ID=CAMNT_0004536825 /DNA_START=343 /DNA_END=510 /DNA_ORIENTATION=-
MASTDIALALRAMGALVTNKEIDSLLKKYDPDGTGTLVLDDYISMMAEVSNKPDN